MPFDVYGNDVVTEPMLRSLIEQLGRAFLDEQSRATGEGEGEK